MGATCGRIQQGEGPCAGARRELEEQTTLVAYKPFYLFRFSGLNTGTKFIR
jgi:8-oxo-dGTP pyrophosphatase MutT (NUDIX family)